MKKFQISFSGILWGLMLGSILSEQGESYEAGTFTGWSILGMLGFFAFISILTIFTYKVLTED